MMKISLSTLSASVLAGFGIVPMAYAVPNPMGLPTETVQNKPFVLLTEQATSEPLVSAEQIEQVQQPTAKQAAISVPEPLVEAVSADVGSPADMQAMLINCASLTQDAMRLACYDTLMQGDIPTATQAKRPIKLGDTLWQTIKGNPQVVYSETETVTLLDGQQNGQLSDKQTEQLEQIAKKFTPLSLAFDLDRNNTPLWTTRPHNPMYILPLYLNAKPNRDPSTPTQSTQHFSTNDMRAMELKFQLSFKVKAAEDLLGTDADLWFGYTQQSHWQVYNEDNSRPFRSHDYQPELFLTQPVYSNLPFGGKLRMLGVGGVHHSNGEDNPLSRSWNRAYLMAGMEWGKLTVMPRLWARVAKGSDGQVDDNPDILDYYGYGDVRFLYQLPNKSNISGLMRYNPSTSKGALQLDYVRPLGKGVSGYVQLFKGYGQSLIDYNHNATSIGIGLMLNDWMGL